MIVWAWLFERRELLTFFFAVIGFVLSIANTAFLLFRNRRNLLIICKTVRFSSFLPRHPVDFEVVLENRSVQTIALSRIFLVTKNHKYEFDWIPQVCFTSRFKQGKEVIHQQTILSLKIPIMLQGLECVGGFLHVETEEDVTLDDLKNEQTFLEVWTSRGKIRVRIPLVVFQVNEEADDA